MLGVSETLILFFLDSHKLGIQVQLADRSGHGNKLWTRHRCGGDIFGLVIQSWSVSFLVVEPSIEEGVRIGKGFRLNGKLSAWYNEGMIK